ncbi:hypothetical protein D3C87_2009160 [compost metagenome]
MNASLPMVSTAAFGTIDSLTSWAKRGGYGPLVVSVTVVASSATASVIWLNCPSWGLAKAGSVIRFTE